MIRRVYKANSVLKISFFVASILCLKLLVICQSVQVYIVCTSSILICSLIIFLDNCTLKLFCLSGRLYSKELTIMSTLFLAVLQSSVSLTVFSNFHFSSHLFTLKLLITQCYDKINLSDILLFPHTQRTQLLSSFDRYYSTEVEMNCTNLKQA